MVVVVLLILVDDNVVQYNVERFVVEMSDVVVVLWYMLWLQLVLVVVAVKNVKRVAVDTDCRSECGLCLCC